MPSKNRDLHGNAPDKSPVALLLIDVINDMEFKDGDKLLTNALPAARKIAALKKRARKAGIPVIYVNDNFGKWRSDFTTIVEHCIKEKVVGAPVARLLKPNKNDYFVLKPKHSAFFDTSLDILLKYLEVKTLILTGFAGNICVLFTANDAYMRDFHIIVPSDCCASNEVLDNEYTLKQVEWLLKADIRPSTEIDVEKLLKN
jgi:nicotinamidase-related amidase